MNFNVEPILYEERKKYNEDYNHEREKMTDKGDKGEWCTYYRAMKTEGIFRLESAEEGVQITAIDESGTTHSQYAKDGYPKSYGICDAENVTFQMKGFSKTNFKVELYVKILHLIENWDWILKMKPYIFF